MKLIFVILFLLFILFSCNNQEQNHNVQHNILKDTTVIQENNKGSVVDVNPEKKQFHTIGNLDIMMYNLSFFNAKQAELNL
jgi:hypothetical protein